jgi:tetratricopeptide (TPR) repeat protein
LIAALDDWSFTRPSRVPPDRLKAIARAAETDPLRASIRQAVDGRDLDGLRRLCGPEENRRVPGPRLRHAFRSLLALDPAASFPLLESIRRESPADFWLNHDLGTAYKDAKPPNLPEAIRCLTAAVALRPDSPGAHLHLGIAYSEKGDLEAALAEYRTALRLKPDFTAAHNSLGIALKARKDLDGAIAEYRLAIGLKPGFAMAHYNLGNALKARGDLDEAIAEYRASTRIDPEYTDAHGNLGAALQDKGDIDGAIAEFATVLKIKPNDATAHVNLGVALADKGDLDGAIAEYRTILRLKPEMAEAHVNLGNALKTRGDLDEAIAEYRIAIQLKPEMAEAHYNLGFALGARNDPDGAIAEYRAALQLQPEMVKARVSLGFTLNARGDVDGAVTEYRAAIRSNPRSAEAYYNLGLVLSTRGDLEGAIDAFRDAIRLNPKEPDAHNGLGLALRIKGDIDGAIAEFRTTIKLKPDLAEALCNLGAILMSQGMYTEALGLFERGHESGSKRADWRYPSGQWVAECRRFVDLEAKLPAILKGEATPKDAGERLILADLSYKRSFYAASARFYAEVLAEHPELADDPRNSLRYNAACMAAMAGSGQGKDEPPPDEAGRLKLRDQARTGLRADLAVWTKTLESGTESARGPMVTTILDHWKVDSDLAGIRDSAALAKLPEAESEALRSLWLDVEALRVRAAGAK